MFFKTIPPFVAFTLAILLGCGIFGLAWPFAADAVARLLLTDRVYNSACDNMDGMTRALMMIVGCIMGTQVGIVRAGKVPQLKEREAQVWFFAFSCLFAGGIIYFDATGSLEGITPLINKCVYCLLIQAPILLWFLYNLCTAFRPQRPLPGVI